MTHEFSNSNPVAVNLNSLASHTKLFSIVIKSDWCMIEGNSWLPSKHWPFKFTALSMHVIHLWCFVRISSVTRVHYVLLFVWSSPYHCRKWRGRLSNRRLVIEFSTRVCALVCVIQFDVHFSEFVSLYVWKRECVLVRTCEQVIEFSSVRSCRFSSKRTSGKKERGGGIAMGVMMNFVMKMAKAEVGGVM